MYKIFNDLLYGKSSRVGSIFLLRMKFTIILLFTIFQVNAASFGQKINLKVKDASIEKVFKALREQSNYNFYYANDMIRNSKLVTLTAINEPFFDVLEKCFSDQPFTYIINKNTVVIRKKLAAPVMDKAIDIIVKGKVLDETNKPVPGVSVKLKGTNTAVITTNDGDFEIKSPEDGILVFSYIGYASQEIPVNKRNNIQVNLKPSEEILNDVVIVGYGTRKKSDVTGAVSVVSEKQLHEIPSGNIATALQGSAPGLSVLKSGGNSHPGSTPVIRIRGARSLGADNNPLIILDGIPFNGSLNDISQDDIVSASILKDASSTAIYGSRGSNGVILITTRRGKNQKAVISYSGYAGFNQVLGHYDVMDANQFLEFRKWAKINGSKDGSYTGIDDPKLLTDVFTDPEELKLYQSGMNTDWQANLYNRALLTNHQVGVTGGTETTQYDMSVGYYNAGGIYSGQGMNRYNVKLSLDHKLGKNFKIGLSSLNSYTLLKGLDINPVNNFLQASPFSTPYQTDGTLYRYLPGSNQNVWNPLADFEEGAIVDNKKRLTSFTTAYLDIDFSHGFKYRLSTGIQISPETQGKFYASNTTKRLGTQNYGYNYNGTGYDFTVENILTYDKVIAKDHTINFTGLFSLQESQNENNNVSYRDVLADYIQYYNPQYASSITSSGGYGKWDILSYMGRLNYTFKDKYLATVTVRADGSSRLAAGNKWHTFPSAALAWNVSKESFLVDSKIISALKLRASYGTTANTSIGSYETIGRLSSIYYNYGSDNVQGTYPTSAANVNLGWENTSSLNFGVDFGLFRDRITGSVEYYKQLTSDILLRQSLPATSGYSSIRNNIGKTENKGMELNLSSVNFEGDGKNGFNWSTGLNVFFNRNKITELSSGATQDINSGWFVGHPNGSIYDYERAGIWQNTPEDIALAKTYGLEVTGTNSVIGTVRVSDINNDGKITADDKRILGNRQPKFEGGMTNRFAYKNFDFSFVTYFKVGGLLKSGMHGGFANSFQAGYNNLDVNYWTPENPGNYWPKPNSTFQFPNYLSTLDTFDASYLKIRSITLGYTLPINALKVINAKSARIYATASNPFTFFSPYKDMAGGLDPETNENVDVNTPALYSMLFGINISF